MLGVIPAATELMVTLLSMLKLAVFVGTCTARLNVNVTFVGLPNVCAASNTGGPEMIVTVALSRFRPGTEAITRYCVPLWATANDSVKLVEVCPAISLKVLEPGGALCH